MVRTNYIKILVLASVLCFSWYSSLGFTQDSTPVVAKMSEDGVQRAEIIVDSYSFKPNHIIVEVNKPVEITLKSVTMVIPHNFTISHPESGMNIDQNISHGEDVIVKFTPTKTGSFDFYCNKKGIFGSHRKKGMEGVIEVKG